MELFTLEKEGLFSTLEKKPFPTEESLEALVYSNRELMGNLTPFARQAKSGDGQ